LGFIKTVIAQKPAPVGFFVQLCISFNNRSPPVLFFHRGIFDTGVPEDLSRQTKKLRTIKEFSIVENLMTDTSDCTCKKQYSRTGFTNHY